MPPMFAYCVFRMMNNGFNDGQFDGELQFLLSIAANFANQSQTSRGSFIDQVRIKPFHAGENSETINKQVLRWNRRKSAQNRPFVFVSNAVTLKKIWFCLRINIHKNRSFVLFSFENRGFCVVSRNFSKERKNVKRRIYGLNHKI